MDGHSVAKRLRAESANADMRLVALTGYGRREDASAAYKAGFDEHLVKPADRLRLLDIISRPPGGGRRRRPSRSGALGLIPARSGSFARTTGRSAKRGHDSRGRIAA